MARMKRIYQPLLPQQAVQYSPQTAKGVSVTNTRRQWSKPKKVILMTRTNVSTSRLLPIRKYITPIQQQESIYHPLAHKPAMETPHVHKHGRDGGK